MKARTLRRHLKESTKNLARNGWMTFASVSAVTVTLILVGVFFVIMMNLNKVATDIEEDVRIRVHIDIAATEKEQEVLRKKIEQLTEVESITFSPKEVELENLIDSLGEEGEAFRLFEQDNPLYDVFVVETKDPLQIKTVAEKIETFDYTSSVKYGQDDIDKLFSFIESSRNVGLVLILGLLFTAMFLISNTIKITIIARRREIEIMRLVGATNAFIRWPFFLEGLFLGVLGAIIPIALITVIYNYAYNYISPKLEGHFIQILPVDPFMYQVGGILILLGAFIGVWGSLMSVRKFLKIYFLFYDYGLLVGNLPYIIVRKGEMGLKKTLLALSVVTTLGLASFTTGFHSDFAYANSKINSLKEQKKEIQAKESAVSSQIDEKNDAIDKVKGEQVKINQEIKRIDLAVADTEEKIREKELEIEETDKAIKKLEEEIEVLKARIEKRNELLKDRARSFQENGNVTYIDVLLGAQSFSDFIDRVGAVAVFVEADQNILREHKADKDELEAKQAEMKQTLADLKQMQADLEQMKEKLSAQKAEKEKVMAALKKKEEQMHAEVLELEEEEALLAAQKRAMQKAIELEQRRLAEQAKRGNGSTPPVSDGTFTRPAAGYISSGFGNRSLGNHFGVDIAASGTVPILAAADGVVIRSYYSASYGNCIFISHSINGQIYTTVYAHMSSRIASEGQVVSKGDQIGYMGNTGHSFGQHLHFELHKGPWNASKSNAINPVGIVPF